MPTANTPAEVLRVAGIDTHKLTHHVAVLDHLGRSVADREFDTTEAGYAALCPRAVTGRWSRYGS